MAVRLTDIDWRELAHQAQVDAFVGPEMLQTKSKIVMGNGLVMVRGRVNHPWFNVAFKLSDELTADEALSRVADFFGADEHMVFARTWADTDLISNAGNHGLDVKPQQPYMVAEGVPGPFTIPEWLTIKSEPSPQHAADFSSVAGWVFGDSERDRAATTEVCDPNEIFGPYSEFFVGYVDGEPAATTSVWYTRGIPGMYWVAVLPEFRGRGIASVMVRNAWRSAIENGARAITLQAALLAVPLYERLGFRTVGTYTKLM